MASAVSERAVRWITGLVAVAIAVSIVHYVDNVNAYEAYPQSDSIPNPSDTLIGIAWFLLTPFAIAGLVLLRRGRARQAAIALAVYSGSGLVGIGHYAVGGTGDFPWWRHAHIVGDIVLGTAVLAVAAWLAARPSELPD